MSAADARHARAFHRESHPDGKRTTAAARRSFLRACKRTALLIVLIASLSITTVASGGPPAKPPDKRPPTAPRGIAVTSAAQAAVSATWVPSRDNVGVAGYGVYLDGSLTQNETGPRTTVSGLACGTGYMLAVDAFDAAGNRSRKTSSAIATAPCMDTRPPTAPTGFRQAATTRDSVVLAWDPSADDVGVVAYGVYRDGRLTQSTSTPSVTFTGMLCGSTYAIAVDAVDAAGNRSSATSTWVTTTACADTQPPSVPTGVKVAGSTETSITLSWSPSTDNVGVAGYGLYRAGKRVGTTTQSTGTVSSLSCDTAYALAVDAYDAADNHSAAATIDVRTAACPSPPDTTPPSAPGGLSVAASTTTTIDLTWTAANDNVGVTGYEVHVGGTLVQTSTVTRATVSTLACGTAYSVAVDAFDAAGNRSAKTTVVATTAACPDTQPPTPPANLVTTSRTATSIALSWSASTDNVGVVGYGLHREGVLVGTSSVTSGIFAGLACGTSYTLAIDAYDAAGNRSQKAAALVTTTACPDTTPPTIPTGLAAASVGQTSLTLNWRASADNVGVAGYDVYRNGGRTGSVTATTSPQSALSCGTSYDFGVVAYDAAGNRSPQASLTASTASCSPSPAPPPAPPGTPALQAVDGGLGYYGQFTNPLPTAASYFPIGAWLRPAHDLEHFGDYANFGMNLFVGVENPEMTDEAMIRANGMKAIVQSDERTRFNDIGSETAGWLLFDEVDMVLGPAAGYTRLDSILAGLPNDGRLRYNNYGKGVLEWESDADAARFVNGRSGGNTFQQVISTDYYWFTDPNALGNSRYGFGSSYGDDVSKLRRLDALDGVRQPVWHFVELGWPWTESATQGGRRILPAEIRSAVWHSVIAGARGIIYFDHNFGPGSPGSTILEEGYEENRAAATAVNTQIKTLAPVLNGPFVTSGHSAADTMAGTVRYMLKWANGKFWVFAGADRGGGSASFSIPCVGNATAVVEGENRSLPISSGSFTDSFADKNAIHIYRIDGGSSCGLS